MRCILLAVTVLSGACGFSITGIGADASVAGDDAPPLPTDDASSCVGAGLVRVCTSPPPTDTLTLDTQTLDTDAAITCTQVLTQASGPDLCVIHAAAISVIGDVTAIGTRPLVLAATTSITIAAGGSVDVSSTSARTGAGANYAAVCDLETYRAGTGEGDSGGGGGGAGGGFGTRGAAGGRGDDNDNQPPFSHKGIPGTAGTAQPTPNILRGGCPGGSGGGGANNVAAIGPAGGASGGAVYLIAGQSLVLTGNVFASGEGGRARAGSAGFMDGGAGGGSGGMIGLDAPMIAVSGIIAANGGGGAGGGDFDGGAPGARGSTIAWNMPATGGGGAPCCGATGGAGTAAAIAPTVGAIDISGGGGGGGGAGIVWIDGVLAAAGMRVSPAPTAH